MELVQGVPQRSACIAIIHQHIVEELKAEHRRGAMKQIPVPQPGAANAAA